MTPYRSAVEVSISSSLKPGKHCQFQPPNLFGHSSHDTTTFKSKTYPYPNSQNSSAWSRVASADID